MDNQPEKTIKGFLTTHLKGGEAFIPMEQILSKMPFKYLGVVLPQLPYSFYELFYHIRFTQLDIIDFIQNPEYEEKDWPKDYWPARKAPGSEKDWENLTRLYFQEREQVCNYILDSFNDMLVPFDHGKGQNLFHESLLIIEHTAYHTGQLVVILRLLGLH